MSWHLQQWEERRDETDVAYCPSTCAARRVSFAVSVAAGVLVSVRTGDPTRCNRRKTRQESLSWDHRIWTRFEGGRIIPVTTK